jgi:hypothetical protein
MRGIQFKVKWMEGYAIVGLCIRREENGASRCDTEQIGKAPGVWIRLQFNQHDGQA